jgi:hypothetical protein
MNHSPPPPSRLASMKAWRWTVAKYDRATALGWFEGQHVELIDGKVVRMAPQLEPHAAGICLAAPVVTRAFGDGCYVRTQMPLRFGTRSKPEPDIAVVPGDPNYYVRHGTPTSALLIIEVSDRSL